MSFFEMCDRLHLVLGWGDRCPFETSLVANGWHCFSLVLMIYQRPLFCFKRTPRFSTLGAGVSVLGCEAESKGS